MSGLRLGPFPVTSGADLNMWTVALESPAERSNYVSLSYYHNLQLLYILISFCSESPGSTCHTRGLDETREVRQMNIVPITLVSPVSRGDEGKA